MSFSELSLSHPLYKSILCEICIGSTTFPHVFQLIKKEDRTDATDVTNIASPKQNVSSRIDKTGERKGGRKQR